MAFQDAKNEFSDAQTLGSPSSGDKNMSTNTVNLGAAGEDGWGNSLPNSLDPKNLHWFMGVNTTMVGASAAVIAQLKTHSAVSMKSAGTVVATITIPALQASGWRQSIAVPHIKTWGQHVGVLYTVSGGNLSAQAFDSGFIQGPIDTQIVAAV